MPQRKSDEGIRLGVKYDDLQLGRVLDKVTAIGPRLQRIAKDLGMTVGQVAGVKRRYRAEWDKAVARFTTKHTQEQPVFNGEEVSKSQKGDEMILRSNSTRIKSLEDLLNHMDVDTLKFEVAEFQVTKNEQLSRNPATELVEVTEYFRVYAKLRPIKVSTEVVALEALVAQVLAAPSRITATPRARRVVAPVLQKLVIADPHIAKYSWAKSTGQQNWDVDVAVDALMDCSNILMDEGDNYSQPIGKRIIALLGDYWHFDTVNGTTTAGTLLDRDSRLQNMIERGTDALLRIIDRSAESAPTELILVPGNHDVTLTWATQRILQAHYRDSKTVTINGEYTARKYTTWGTNLFGYTHGDKARKKLPGLMAIERREDWGNCRYREFHTGHFHTMEEKVQGVDGVLIRTAPALCPPDDWHADNGFLGSLRAMESFLYHQDGGLIGSFVASPDFLDR